MIEIRKSTREDLELFYDKNKFPISSRSWSVIKDNVLACVFGYTIRREGCIVFCDIKEGYGKIEIMKTARKAVKILSEDHKKLMAIQDQELCNSEKFLNFLGFYRVVNSDIFEYGGTK